MIQKKVLSVLKFQRLSVKKESKHLFRLPPPGAYYLYPEARAIFLQKDLLCNDACSVTGVRITYWGAQTEKIRIEKQCIYYEKEKIKPSSIPIFFGN